MPRIPLKQVYKVGKYVVGALAAFGGGFTAGRYAGAVEATRQLDADGKLKTNATV